MGWTNDQKKVDWTGPNAEALVPFCKIRKLSDFLVYINYKGGKATIRGYIIMPIFI